MKKNLLALLIAVPAFACQDAPPETLPFTSLEKGWHSNYTNQGNLVFSDQNAWETHYKAAHSNNVPQVDFTKETVLAVYMGTKPTNGYSVEIKEVRNFPPLLEVLVQTSGPQKGKMYLQVITHPYHIVKIEKTSKPIDWTYEPAAERKKSGGSE